ncbi:MAG: DUF2256 domain-containing protein [Planctomycetota bacterium]
MPNKQQKNLPAKTCPVCKRPFTWRKKWQRDWENVKYCSKACAKKGIDSTAKQANRAK